MQKTETVSFNIKTTQKMQNTPTFLSKKKDEMKVKVRKEISQAFH